MPRLNIEISKEKSEEILKLMEISGVTTRKDLFNNALTLLKWALRQKQGGKVIGALSDDDHFIELDMPIFENAKNSSIKL